MTWRLGEKRTDIDEWVARRAARRYGGEDASTLAAWDTLRSSVYDDAAYVHSHLEEKPAFVAEGPRAHAAAVASAWADLAASELTPTGPYLYDIADVGRQALANAFDAAVAVFSDAFDRCIDWADTFSVKEGVDIVGDGTYYDTSPSPDCGLYYGLAACNTTALEAACVATPGCAGFNTNGWLKRQSDQFVATEKTDAFVRDRASAGGACAPSLASIAAGLDGLLSDLDRLLAATPMFLLGEWLADAAKWAGDADEAALYMLNAKNQISLWGPNGEINDYASKQWAGMISDYHRARWALFTDAVLGAARANASFDSAQFDSDVLALGQSWYLSNATYPATPSGDDPVEVGRELLQKYASVATSVAGFEATVDTSVAGDLSSMPGLPLGTLAWLCELEPACAGFTDSGALASQVTTTEPQSGTTLYVKLP